MNRLVLRVLIGCLLSALAAPTSATAQTTPPAPTTPSSTPDAPADSSAAPGDAPPSAEVIKPPVLKPDDSAAPARVDSAMLDRAYRRARTTRDIGISLATPGVALDLLGVVLLTATSRDQQIFAQSNQIIGGTISIAVGLAVAIPGIYLWITGQDDMDSVVWRRRQLTSSPP